MQEAGTLVLEILKQGQTLKMSVFERLELASTLRHYSQCAVSSAEIDKLCQEISFILNKAGKNSAYDKELIKGLIKSGRLLWDHLLTPSVKEKLKSSQISSLILSTDEELINIPWELLYDGRSFLCLAFNIGRVIRTREPVSRPRYRSFAGVLKMLIMVNPTNDLKSAYLEGVNIKNQFDRKSNNVHIDFKSTYIDKMYVKKNLCDYDIVHFAGHCEYEADNPDNSGWVLSDSKFTIQDILAMGSAVSLPALIFSNACHSAVNTAKPMEADYQENNYSLASAFLFSGVRHYIGAIRKIEDPVSLSFSKEFYAQLISGKSMGESIRLGRLKLISEYGIMPMHWASYLLYGDPNFILFRPKVKPKSDKPRINISLHRKRLAWFFAAVVFVSVCICLYIWLPTINPNTYRLFLESQRSFRGGQNQRVISQSGRIIKNEPSFLAIYPLLADTYQRLGDKDNALKYYFDYAFFSEKRRDKKNLSSAYIGIGWIYHLYGEYAKAFEFYNKSIALSKGNKDRLNEAIALRKLAVWYMDKGEDDKALELLTKSSEINRERQYSYKHRYNLACDYFNLGLLFLNKDDLATAKEFYDKSFRLFNRLKLARELSDYYFNVGEVYSYQKEYQKALDFYFQGLKIDQKQGNMPNIASDYNMIGELYVEIDNFTEAEKYFYQALSVCKDIDAPLESAAAYNNLGSLYKRKGQKNKAREYLRQAQEIYTRIDTPDYQRVKQELLSLD
ncbi:MAG: tetratricopeptide repeat protein [Candidatus Omnitrophota bacterium]